MGTFSAGTVDKNGKLIPDRSEEAITGTNITNMNRLFTDPPATSQ